MGRPKQYPLYKTIKKVFPKATARRIDRRIRLHLCDAAVVSYPKSGRTWLRSMLTVYFSRIYGTPADILYDFANIHAFDSRAPKLFFTHEAAYSDVPDSLAIDRKRFEKKKVIFLARDPRDVIVSLYAHRVHRDKTWEGPIEDFIASPEGGYETALRYYHLWSEFLAKHEDAIVLRYEDFHREPGKSFEELLRFLNQPVDSKAIRATVEETEFARLKKMESQSAFQSGRLRTKEPENPEAYKVRRGKIGGFTKDLNPALAQEIGATMDRVLQGAFGYRTGEHG
jgi:alcohol sulfotransferase